jgi:hypothetical protein
MEKVSKQVVNYREADGKRRCGNCGMFHRVRGSYQGKCDLVLGFIHPDDTCDEWVKRE